VTGIIKKYKNLPDGVKASLWFTICSILQKGISFITVPIFTRMLSTEEYGVISLFSSWQSVLSIFATLNLSYQIFNNGMVKYENDRDGYTTAMLGLSNLTTTILFVVYLIFRVPLNKLFEIESV
jgi:O-antigen/teichoic acid export membrane protein